MDPTLLQLFTPEEILERLALKQGSGTLHLFTTRESANLFLREGVLIAAAKGLTEGEEVLKQVLTWTNANYSWQPGNSAPPEAFKPTQIHISDYLAKRKAGLNASGKIPSGTGMVNIVDTSTGMPVHTISAHAKAATTMPIGLNTMAVAMREKESTTSAPLPAQAPIDLSATKTIDPSAKSRTAQDEALVKKHPLVLISMLNPEQRVPITRASSLIGRNPACDIAISHASISRQHCLLQITDRGLHVKDLGTTNGTKVNGIIMTEGYVNVGDKLTIGHLAFELAKA
jgi:hypothetical protein